MRPVPYSVLALIACLTLLASQGVGQPLPARPPDLSGMWGRNSFDFEPLASGPRPVENAARMPNGASDPRRRVGDYTSPILTPEAADIVRSRADVSRNGGDFLDASNQCAPYPPPYSHAMGLQLQILQRNDEVVLLYPQDQGTRHIHVNGKHPRRLAPSWYGDSIGHYEGDTLVVDTIGFKVGPLSMVDRYGTPYTSALHLVERFRLIDGAAANQVAEQHERDYGRTGGPPGVVIIDRGAPKGLQVEFSVDDPGTFVTPWSASVTYRRIRDEWPEYVCAENTQEYYSGHETRVPNSEKPDF